MSLGPRLRGLFGHGLVGGFAPYGAPGERGQAVSRPGGQSRPASDDHAGARRWSPATAATVTQAKISIA